VVSQRVADLLADGFPPEGIVAFTFTERAAEELKDRIGRRAEDRLGPGSLDRLAGLFVGTIHAYCFRLLQQRVPKYETYDVLDDNQLTAFLSREEKNLGLRQFDADRPDPNKRIFAGIRAFLKGVGVVENELLYTATLDEPFKTVIRNYYETLDRYRLLTYGLQIVRAVRELERPELAAEVHSKLRHLIVDEYQDVNPAQERLIRLLTGPAVELCVVGDDQQAIYQWRGSKVANIMTFHQALRAGGHLRDRHQPPEPSSADRRGQRFRRDHPRTAPKDHGPSPRAGHAPSAGGGGLERSKRGRGGGLGRQSHLGPR